MKKITLLFFVCLAYLNGYSQTDCASAVAITDGTYTVAGVNGTAPTTDCPGYGTANPPNAGAWYVYTNNTSGNLIINITTDLPANAANDTKVSILTGTCSTLECYADNDDIVFIANGDPSNNFLTEVDFLAEAGQSYYIVWDATWDATGFDFVASSIVPDCTTGFPYFEDFASSDDFVGCYRAIDEDGNGNSWIQQELELQPLVPSYFSTNGTSDAQKEDYLFSPAFALTAGNTYDYTIKYNGADAANGAANEDLEVLVAQGNTVADANAGTSIFTDTGITQTGAFADVENQASTGTGSFTPTTSGDYYFVLKSTGSPFTIGGTTGFLLVFEYSVDETLSVDTFQSSNFNYFVDAQNMLNLSANQSFEQVRLYNLLGQEVLIQNLTTQNENVDLNNLSTGVYLAQVQINGAVKTFKITKK